MLSYLQAMLGHVADMFGHILGLCRIIFALCWPILGLGPTYVGPSWRYFCVYWAMSLCWAILELS